MINQIKNIGRAFSPTNICLFKVLGHVFLCLVHLDVLNKSHLSNSKCSNT